VLATESKRMRTRIGAEQRNILRGKMIQLSKPYIAGREEENLKKVLESGIWARGPFNALLEEMFCEYLGSKHAIACSSGTMGLYVAMESLRMRKQEEWEIPYPIGVTCSEETFGATMNAVEMLQDGEVHRVYDGFMEYRIYVPCHILGTVAPDFVCCEQYPGWGIVEDACESLGTKYEDRYLGTFGDFGVFGFYPNKQISCGEGGMIVTDDDELARLARMIVNQGRGEAGHEISGINARMSEFQAAVGCAQMEHIEEILEMRRNVANTYLEMLDADALRGRGIETPFPRDSWFAFPLTALEDNACLFAMQEHLSGRNIQSAIYFPKHERYDNMGFKWKRRLCIPFWTDMCRDDIETVAMEVNKWSGQQ
jgi:perosamine synthetase